ncbi:MAG: class I SAM-dependent methyltransferase [Candidatus Coatesbacteria bacterium]|nr:MAG: class I SAM-dependent methyltransferase [Candidatus Coatesbacteria bacterium]
MPPRDALGPLGWLVWRTFRRYAGRRRYDRLVDLGGGEGYFASLFTGRRKIVVDAVAPALAVARGRGLAAVQADLRLLPFKDGACDLILLSDVLEHVPGPDVEAALREAARVLQPGGVALVNTSCYGIYLRRWLRRAPGGGRLDRDDLKDGHLNRLTADELQQAVAAAGLKMRRRRYYKHLFQPLTALAVRLLRGEREAGEVKADKAQTLAHGQMRFLNALRIFVATWDAVLFGWLPGGAVLYKLEK